MAWSINQHVNTRVLFVVYPDNKVYGANMGPIWVGLIYGGEIDSALHYMKGSSYYIYNMVWLKYSRWWLKCPRFPMRCKTHSSISWLVLGRGRVFTPHIIT